MLKTVLLWVSLVAIVLLGTIAIQASLNARKLNTELTQTLGHLQATELEKAEWIKANHRLTEVELPHLTNQLEAAKRIASEPIVRTRIVTETVEVPIEIPTLVEVPVECSTDLEPTHGISVGVSNDLQLAIDVTETGDVFYTGKLFTKLSGPLFPEPRIVEYDLPQTAQVGIAPIVPKALAYYKNRPPRIGFVRQPKHFRLGLSAGLGMTVDYPTGRVAFGPTVLFGVQF